MSNPYKQLSLRERAAMFANLIREPGWELLQHSFRPEIRTRVTDKDAKEALLYEAIRAQLIQEFFSTPLLVINQAEREWSRNPARTDDFQSDNSL
jgi:hypothetical protein